jgi:hypothetical protein
MVSVIRMGIDTGHLVRVSLPGAAHPVIVEDAGHCGAWVALEDGTGGRYYVASPDQVVVIAAPLEPGRPRSRPAEPQMTVDGTGTGGA